MRPFRLTAAAAILGMIPNQPTVFWGPMAYALMAGLVVTTLLPLVFLPALYVAPYRITPFKETNPFAGESFGASTDDLYGVHAAQELALILRIEGQLPYYRS